MNYFSHYPYQNFSDYNLDWLLKLVKEVNEKLSEYLESSVITFADPITWDITEQYTALTCVIDSDGTAYLSKRPVPAGVDISNTNYWLPIFNYDDNINTLRSQIAYNARNSNTTGVALTAGDLVFWNGLIYKVTADMPAGTAFIIDSNIVKYTVSDRINDLVDAITNSIANETAARESADNILDGKIADETTARESADNILDGKIADETTARESADNAIIARIDALPQNKDYITPEDFGAVGDDITDDSAAFQAMFDSIDREGVLIILTAKAYRVDNPLTCSANQVRIAGLGVAAEYFPAVITNMTSGTLISFTGGGCQMQNVRFRGRSAMPTGATLTLLDFNADNLAHDGNVDAVLNQVHLLYATTGVRVTGRNLQVNNCLLSSIEHAIEVNETQISTENRGYHFSNNRVHGCGYMVWNLCRNTHGYNRTNMFISNNFADLSRGFFYGYGGGVDIANNYINCFGIPSNQIIINMLTDNLNPTVYQNAIRENHIIAADNSNIGIALDTNLKADVINNIIENTSKDGIRIGEGVQSVCNGNILNNCGRGNGQWSIMIKTLAKGSCCFNVLKNTTKIIYQASGHTMVVSNNIDAT